MGEEKKLLLIENIANNNVLKKRRLLRFRRLRNIRNNLHLIPNLFTLGNAFFGFCSIIFATQGDVIAAAYFILLGALMDMLDGRVARFFRVSSDLGLQLDSLSDAISFCLAPAILMYFWELRYAGFLGFIACAFFMLAGLVRLARFNITSEQQTLFFLGIPTTMAGCFLATMLLNTHHLIFHPHLLFGLLSITGMLAYLMISSIKFPTFKHVHKRWITLAGLCVGAFVVSMGLIKVLLLVFIGYFIISFEYLIRSKIKSLIK